MMMRALMFLVLFLTFDTINTNCLSTVTNGKGTKEFLSTLFKLYGKENNAEKMTLKEFGDLLKSLEVGKINIKCDQDDTNCIKNSHKRNAGRTRRDSHDAYNSSQHSTHWVAHNDDCLQKKELLSAHGINTSTITKEDFVSLCPSIIQQIDSKQCIHYHRTKFIQNNDDETPLQKDVWLYGMLSITIISLLSLVVITMIPCLKKSFYHKIMAYLVALAVGTLAGDAMLHLIPHAFADGANAATQSILTEEDKLKQHYSQVWRALFVLLGIYLFFLVEQLMKLKIICKGGHGHSHGGHGEKVRSDEEDITPPASPCADEDKAMVTFDKSDDQVNLQENGASSPNHILHDNEAEEYHADDRHHHHHHGEKNITKDTKISSLAWMVIVGDGFHNFSDGLAVGAAYSASLSSGLSTTIAVFCHELPHELGDFAILIKSGMTIKQAIVYNLMSAILAYIGLIIGILIGGYEMGRHFILSITAGLFLYISLADMLPELTHQEVPKQSKCSTFFCQHLGILSGIAIMLFISLFEHAM